MKKSEKVSLSKEAIQSLESMLNLLNDGFKEGKITKPSLNSWIIQKFQNKYFEKSVLEIRDAHRDPIRILEAQIAELRAARKSYRA